MSLVEFKYILSDITGLHLNIYLPKSRQLYKEPPPLADPRDPHR